nr:hypothetical protein GCM10017745_05980 [Saccharothrix mutabilis subsp. capreolus]
MLDRRDGDRRADQRAVAVRPRVHRVDHTRTMTGVVTETVALPPATTTSEQVLAVPLPTGAPTTSSDIRLFQDPPSEPAETTTTTAEPTRTAFVSTTSSTPTVTPTTVTLVPTSPSLKAT